MPATRPGQGTSAAGRWMDGFPRKNRYSLAHVRRLQDYVRPSPLWYDSRLRSLYGKGSGPPSAVRGKAMRDMDLATV